MKVSALDDNGKPVDWWFMYKVPKLAKDAQTTSAVGYEYLYYDAVIDKIVKSPNLLTDGNGALDLTLKSVFGKPDDSTGWILYNDEMPSGAKRTDNNAYGHTKGVLAFDVASGTGFWLLHSWPNYADPSASDMPTPIYGQTFLCISLDIKTAGAIAAQMTNHQTPQVYLPRIPKGLNANDPLYKLSQPLSPNAPGDSNVIECNSIGGMAFKVIAKNSKWNKDFWNDLVGPTLKEDMDVETWIRGKIPPTLDSDGIHKTFDVKYIDFSPLGFPYTWPETQDHAKWGITLQNNWICVGDINRMISQEKRGGGTIAFQNQTLWSALSKTDLLVAPPGHTRVDAMALIKATHTVTHPPLAKKAVAQTSAKKTVTKVAAKQTISKPAIKKVAAKKVAAKKVVKSVTKSNKK